MKKILAVVLSLAMILTTFPMSVFASDFTDMPNDWSKIALKNAVNNELLSGYDGNIMPKENLTRAQMAVIINRAFAATQKADLCDYSDVSVKAWYYDDMAKAVEMETFVGNGDKLIPESNITRQEVFIVLARAFKLSGASENVLDKFTDKDLVSSWAKDATASIVTAGYVVGSNSKLNPKENITRAEFAQIMDNILKNYIKEAGTYTENMNGNVMINVPNVILKDMKIDGDLIIGDGVGDGDVTLDNTEITGRTVIRGGGVNSIKIIGNSDVKNIVIARVNGQTRVYTEEGIEIGDISVDGNDDVIIEGNVGNVTIIAPDITVTATKAEIQIGIIEGENSKIILSKQSTINNAEIIGENAEIIVEKYSQIENIIVNAEGADINGQGEVGEVEANADDISVSTTGTKVTAAEGTTRITVGGNTLIAGSTEIVDETRSRSNNRSNNRSSSSTSPLSSFEPVTLTQTGDILNDNVQYQTSEEVIAALPTEILVTLEDLSVVNMPVNWADTDVYDVETAGPYTFTASWGDMQTGANNDNSLEAPTVEVIVEEGDASTSENYFTFDETTGTITDYNEEGGLVVAIPSTIDGVEVKIIGASAFYNNNVTKVSIPEGVTSIGDSTFYNCDALTKINLPSSLTSISKYAFYNCDVLTEIDIPDSIEIGYGAFQYCTGLTSLTIGDSVNVGYGAFEYCSSLKSVTIGNDTINTSGYGFYGCNALTTLSIGNNAIVGSWEFDGIDTITTITIGNGVTFQGFSFNDTLFETAYLEDGQGTYLYDGSDWTRAEDSLEIRTYDFEEVKPLAISKIDESNKTITVTVSTGIDVTSLVATFTKVENSTITVDGVTQISGITANNFTNPVEYIVTAEDGSVATYIVTVEEGDVSTSESYFTFDKTTGTIKGYNGKGGLDVVIPSMIDGISVEIIGGYAFNNSSVTKVYIPEGVTSIGEKAYFSCDSLTEIHIPVSVTSIGEWAFYECDSLTGINIPEGVAIGDSAFKNCTCFTNLTIPDSVEIGSEAFVYCSGLTNLTIGDSVEIGSGAFACCTNLESVAIGNNTTSTSQRAFYSCNVLTTLSIGNDVTIAKMDFTGIATITSITIGSGVTFQEFSFNNTLFETAYSENGQGTYLYDGSDWTRVED